ncbi:hypothetical protein PGT21_035985 [Puccinia graminis f. sp. tritici]|uniref:Uncharacterized protein n=1 Tax=Puccinia graminis f. sp. tritici TaxID=56615 RepID=A0A5B0R3C3_PUCGR|nr:hypothetical protein PGT21_035985 [Puccinia graminis f. sp. tritici]
MASTVPLAVMASFCKRLQSAEEAGTIVYRIRTHIQAEPYIQTFGTSEIQMEKLVGNRYFLYPLFSDNTRRQAIAKRLKDVWGPGGRGTITGLRSLWDHAGARDGEAIPISKGTRVQGALPGTGKIGACPKHNCGCHISGCLKL